MAWSSNSADDEVDDSNAPVSVEGCLALYTEPELLSEPWHCEHCTKAARANTNEAKNGIELMESASERKGNEEMMADGVERQDGEKLVMSCSKKEDIDQIMTMDGCSDNVHPDMQFTEGEYADPALAELEQTPNGNFAEIGNTNTQETVVLFTTNKLEQSNCKTYQQEHCPDMKSSTVELTSFSKQPHDSLMQQNDGNNVDMTAEATSTPLSCGDNDSVSCSATNTVKPECGGIAREEVISSLPSDAERILPSVKDNEDANTRNQDRRKRMKMVGKAHQVQDKQNEKKENKTKLIWCSSCIMSCTIGALTSTQESELYVCTRSKENDSTMYRLVGVVEHMGSMTGGHYIALRGSAATFERI
ncbi:hypothetical protein PR202_ga15345 [Eleusine coracana subsp. coracana]|uniref:Peptidase C19 ubiquitin carboxyl-terminal hydrolase domain-containing protein n=1 Tax=Eleusine coracana subsp. coracana TaxID=191504 RepID=A0AAV5CJZ5_ELECO|nr:hypothetical protein PR202_ga15345 [Eleusine coracana subsp. coracana]